MGSNHTRSLIYVCWPEQYHYCKQQATEGTDLQTTRTCMAIGDAPCAHKVRSKIRIEPALVRVDYAQTTGCIGKDQIVVRWYGVKHAEAVKKQTLINQTLAPRTTFFVSENT